MKEQDAPLEVLERFQGLMEAAQWTFAKTMPENPHWYTLRKRWADDALFAWAVEVSRRFGYEELFGGKVYRVLNAGGFKYWTMGSPLEETILMNRKPLPERTA